MWYRWGEGSSRLMSLAKETHHSLKAVDLNLGFQMPHHFPILVTGYWSSGSHLFTFTPFPQLLHLENKGGSPHQQHDPCPMSAWFSDFHSLESFWQEVIICSPQILVCTRLSWRASPIRGDSVGLGCHCISYKSKWCWCSWTRDHPLSSTEGFVGLGFLNHARTSSLGQWPGDPGWQPCWEVSSESHSGSWDGRSGHLSLGQASRRHSPNRGVNSPSSLSLPWNRPPEPVLLKL